MDPIQVNATPKQAQIAAGIRQVGLSLGLIFAAFGCTAWANKVGIVVALAPQFAVILTIVGPIIWGGFIALGQMATRKQAKTLAVVANAAPNAVATVK